MKHTLKVTLVILGMFFITQLIGLAVINQYSPEVEQVTLPDGNVTNITSYNLPYGMDPPKDINPASTLISVLIAIAIAVVFILILMKYKAEFFLRTWFFIVVTLALGITINAFLDFPFASLVALGIALPLSALKLFQRNMYAHNITELLIYPGIAAIFVPLFNVWTVILLLILISIYDIYAVWHAGFMQKMAEYQIKKLRFFTGFFVPYVGKNDRGKIKEIKTQMRSVKTKKEEKEIEKKLEKENIKVNVAILGGGDVVFPIILTGVVFNTLGFLPSLSIPIGATLALAGLFYSSKKGQFYPAMPFITAGCLLGLLFAYLI